MDRGKRRALPLPVAGSPWRRVRATAAAGSGNVYLGGNTTAVTGFPVSGNAYDHTFSGNPTGFVAELNATATARAYATFLGGSGAQLTALGVAGSNAVAATEVGGGAVTVSELNADGTALAGSLTLGGGVGKAIATDTSSNVWVGGQAYGSAFPQVGATQAYGGASDGFVTELTPNLGAIQFSTFIGGTADDAVTGLALGPGGVPTVTGWTNSSNLPVSRAFQANPGGGQDAFIAQYSNAPAAPVFTSISPDSGSSSTDRITNARNISLFGTAAPSSTVTLSRGGVVIGTATADANGNWSFNYTSVTLPEGVTSFTATATLNGVTGPASQPFLVTVDLTAPAVTLSAPPTTSSTTPQITVSASDLNGLPNGTPVTVDVDTNNDGNFTDPGETGYANGMLYNGTASITLPPLPIGTVRLRARVTDVAGNPGQSAVQSMTVTGPGSVPRAGYRPASAVCNQTIRRP